MARLAILDRDGVINADSDAFVRSVAEWRPLAGSIDAIASLHRGGFTVTVATNQSGIGRGLFPRAAVHAMHRKLRRLVRAAGGDIAVIELCPHRPDDGCACRKPGTAMLERIGRRTGLPLEGALVVGDAMRDLEAGARFLRTLTPFVWRVGGDLWLVRTGKGRRTLAAAQAEPPAWWRDVRVGADLADVVARVLA